MTKEYKDENHREFWRKIEQIKEITIPVALHGTDIFRVMLKYMILEIRKSSKNLNEFLKSNDMKNFRIEVHGLKGSLANIGAMELAAKAYSLEAASEKKGSVFCSVNLPDFLEELNHLNLKLDDAFLEIINDGKLGEIPPELPPILKKLINAFDEIDIVLIDEEIKKLDALNLSGALGDEVELIKDAAIMMDYDMAVQQIHKLLNHK